MWDNLTPKGSNTFDDVIAIIENAREGYHRIRIYTPMEVVENENE